MFNGISGTIDVNGCKKAFLLDFIQFKKDGGTAKTIITALYDLQSMINDTGAEKNQ